MQRLTRAQEASCAALHNVVAALDVLTGAVTCASMRSCACAAGALRHCLHKLTTLHSTRESRFVMAGIALAIPPVLFCISILLAVNAHARLHPSLHQCYTDDYQGTVELV